MLLRLYIRIIFGSLGIAVVDPRILGCVRTHPPKNTDNSKVTLDEPNFFKSQDLVLRIAERADSDYFILLYN
jgi:hypothetical protein